MNRFAWIAQEEELTEVALTVLAQATTLPDGEVFVSDVFMPRNNVDSIELRRIAAGTDFRPATDRREWNQRGRQITARTANMENLEMIPIEGFWKIGEREMQKYRERVGRNQQAIRDLIGVEIPQRTRSIAQANLRRQELDFGQSWSRGTMRVMNVDAGTVQTVSYGFDAARYQTMATSWSDVSLNAYNEFLAWVEDGRAAIGSVGGAVVPANIYRIIQADAPKGLNGITLTRRQFEDQFEQDLGRAFTFYDIDHEIDQYIDAGLLTTKERVWPEQIIALVPQGIAVGEMAYAPLVRAYDLIDVDGDAEIDERGQGVFREIENGGREMTHEVQLNSFPLPNERLMWVADVINP